LDNLQASGINVAAITADQLSSHKNDPVILVLGGQNAPENVGAITNELMTDVEKKEVLASPDSKNVFIVLNPWAANQTVIIFAGYEKEQTRKAFSDAQGDLLKIFRFNESQYPTNSTVSSATVPSLNPTQPFTEVNAYEAKAIIGSIPNLEVIDVRGTAVYDAGHIPGAVSMPVRVIEQNTGTLSKDKTYLLYCGGNSESINAGNMLAAAGYKKIYRLVDGYMAWRRAGYPKEVTP